MTLRANERERIIQQHQARQEGWARWAKPSRFIGFLVILVSLIVGIWFLVQESEDPQPNMLPLLKADEEPYKVKVDDQEVLSVRHQDKLVYSRIHNGEETPHIEHILPAPETPIDLTDDNPVEIKTHAQTQVDIEKDTTVETAPHALTDSFDAIADLINQEQSEPSTKSGFTVRIATMDSKDLAEQEWKRLQRKHKTLLSGKTPIIKKVDLGQKGIKYTLEVGTYSKDTEAESVAKALNGVKLRGGHA